MPGFAPMPTGWKERLLAEVRRDKKKTALLSVLLVVGIVVGARAVLSVSGTAPAPVQAGAASGPPAIPGVSAAPPAPASPAAAPGANPSRAPALKDLRARQKVTEDIFAVKVQYFPQDQESNVALVKVAVPASQAIDANLVRAATVLARARTLSLQSTIISRTPKAIINGQLVGVGETVQGFEVVEVQTRSCVLVQDGVRVVLEMKDQ